MKKTERYFYPAIFTYEPEQEIAVVFPDLDCATSGANDDDALLSARELLGCVLHGLKEDGKEIPAPTPLSQITAEPNDLPSDSVARLVLAWDPDYTKLTPMELAKLEEAENGEYINAEDINWED